MVNITVTGLDRVVASAGIPTRRPKAHGSLGGSATPLLGGYERTALRATTSQPLVIPAPEHLVPVG